MYEGPYMLFLRYQHQRQEEEAGGGHRDASGHEMRRKINDRDVKSESHRAATRGTLICIFVCGGLLLAFGLSILFVGLFEPVAKKDPAPWLVIGPTCIVLGILVLLLSVEIIIKLRRISASSGGDDSDDPIIKGGPARQSWGGITEGASDVSKSVVPKPVPVVIHPATPLEQLDATLLSGNVQHR